MFVYNMNACAFICLVWQFVYCLTLSFSYGNTFYNINSVV